MLFHRSYRDEDTIEEGAESAGALFSATRRQAGEGRQIPQEGNAGPKPRRVGGTGNIGLARTASAYQRVTTDAPFGAQTARRCTLRVVYF